MQLEMRQKMTLVGSIEAGGTKFVLEAADEDGKIVAEGRIPTTSPEETLQKSQCH